jgi:hypothetical protein
MTTSTKPVTPEEYARAHMTASGVATASVPASAALRRIADLTVAVAAVLAAALLLVLGRGLTFFADEWAVIENRPLGVDSFLRPFNEHWLGIQVTVYRGLFEVVGLHTYLPYHALLVGLHVIVGLEVYGLVRRATHALLAAAIAVVVLFFGSGLENLFWAMQIGFVGSIALGLGALLLVDRRVTRARALGAVVLLTLSVMTSGFGLFLLAFVGLDLLFDPRRRRWIPTVLIPAGVWLVWYLAVGRAGVGAHGNPFTVEGLLNIPSFVIGGIGAAFGAAGGVGETLGLVVAGAVIAATGLVLRTPGPVPRRTLASVGAIIGMYALLGLVRASDGADANVYTRYTYLSGMLALIAIAGIVGRRAMPAVPRRRLAAVALATVAAVVAVSWNVRLLVVGREVFAERADLTRAFVELGLSDPLPAGVDPRLSLILVPSPEQLRAIVARYGSPLSDSLSPAAVHPIPDAARAEALDRAQHPPDWLLAGCGGDGPQPAGCDRFVPTAN